MHPSCKIHTMEQGSDEWHEARNGLLTASEMNLVLTPTLKTAANDKSRAHVNEIAAQRISGWTEPTFIGDHMLRGHADEIKARDLYSDKINPVEEMGFITRDMGGFTLGYSPDGVDVMGQFGIECKSRLQKHQIKTIASQEVPTEHMLQLQTGMLVTGWDYIDYISYCGGLPMCVIKVGPDQKYIDAILAACETFEEQVAAVIAKVDDRQKDGSRLFDTEREIEQEIFA